MSATQQINDIIAGLTAALPDAGKVDGGQKAAAGRVRKAAQAAKVQLQTLRTSVLPAKTPAA